ncbi:MAG: sulfatase [Aureliella sp.]
MNRIYHLVVAAIICLPTALQAADRPNVVWLISEDNSHHYLELFDPTGAPTPRIAELASTGLLYRHAFSNAPVCSVARTTLMTSCLGPRIGTQFHRRSVVVPMPPGVKMFPAYLRQAGYYTTNNQKKDYNAVETKGTWDASSRQATWRNRAEGQPFFHMQSFGVTHESSLHFPQSDFDSVPNQTPSASVSVAPYHPDTDLFRYTVARYHDNIQKMDAQIGAVVDQLSEDGLLDDTFIFYFGDHGGVLPRGKGYNYESGLHVPLVIHVPKNFRELAPQQPGSDVDGFVQFIDFGATVLQLAGVPIPEGIDGRPFLGLSVTAQDVASRQSAFGYSDRFDEKYDLVRTLRKGKYEYVRSYQPFNFDGLQNNYRYIMLAYQQWRSMYKSGQLNEAQSQFFRTRPAEMLFDIESDPHEVNNLATDPQYVSTLAELRQELHDQVSALPDLSFYPESVLVDQAFRNPVAFGKAHDADIAALVDLADLALLDFDDARDSIAVALNSSDSMHRYWGLIVCSCFRGQAAEFYDEARRIASDDNDVLVRVRAAEFLALAGQDDPTPTIKACLAKTKSGVAANLILNTAVLMRDGDPSYPIHIDASDVHPDALGAQDVRRRLSYFAAKGGKVTDPQGKNIIAPGGGKQKGKKQRKKVTVK